MHAIGIFVSILIGFLASHAVSLGLLAVVLVSAVIQAKTSNQRWKARAGRTRAVSILLLLLAVSAVGCDELGEPILSGCNTFQKLDPLFRKAMKNAVRTSTLLHGPQNAASSPAALTSTPALEFQGNNTLLAPPIDSSGNLYGVGLERQADCSLTEYILANYNPTASTFAVNSTVPSYQNTLHSLAGLTTTANQFSNGCKDSPLGISSTGEVVLGPTKDGSKWIVAGLNPYVGEVSLPPLIAGTVDLTTGTISQTALTAMPYPASVAMADVNGDGYNDLIVVGMTNTTTLAGAADVFLSNGDGTFQPPVSYPTGLNPTAVAIDDVNKDGKLDLVVTGYIQGLTTGGVQTLLGNGDGTFQAEVASPTTGGYYLATGDFNGDGNKDVVLSNGDILLGKGDGTFLPAAFTLPLHLTTGVADAPVVGDFNKDGKLDIAINVTSGPYISVFLGNGDGTFTAGRNYVSIYDSHDLTATDIDGDGNLDLVVGVGSSGKFGPSNDTGTGIFQVLMGNGDGTFQSAQAYPNATGAGYFISNSGPAFAVGDFNGDGKPDLLGAAATAVGSSGLLLLKGDGAGSFSAGSPIGTSSPGEILAADMNGDGKLDAVIADSQTSVGIALGNGDGSFQPVIDYALPNSSSIVNMAVGDFNGDGKPDVLVTANNNTGGAIYLFLNSGGGKLAAATTVDTPAASPLGLGAGDLNGDGKLDFVITTTGNAGTSTPGSMLVYLGHGDGSFANAVSYSPGFFPGPVAIADLNKDGKLDVIVGSSDQIYANGTLSVYLGKGDGTLETPQTLAIAGAGPGSSLAIADMNGDGNPDVVWGQSSPVVIFGNGDGTLQSPLQTGLGFSPSSVEAVDVNGDQRPDLIFVNDHSLAVMLNLYGNASTGGGGGTPPPVPPDFTLAANANSLTIAPGGSGTVALSVTPVNGFNQALSFACSGLPSGAACSFSPASVTPSGSAASTTTMTITTTAPSTGKNSNAWPFAGGGATLALGCLFFFGKRKRLPAMLCLMLLVGIGGMTIGCGGGSSHGGSSQSGGGSGSSGGGSGSPGTPAGTSTVTVTATGSGTTPASHTTTVSLTIQ